ncbi:MAG TPA: phenylacetate--CoA ligase family protein [Burkholderiaceae bacterium]|nr:phenylacetate--CoA ligase family protein [Burkholderiaceae bacterium]
MVIDSLARMFGAARPVDWWRGVDDMWRWGARVRDIWAYDAAGPAEQAAIRLRRTAALLEHARTHSAFFRAHYRYVAPGCTELASYPPVSRKQLMGSFDDWVTDPDIRLSDVLSFVSDPARIAEPYLGKYAIWTSSGTTGIPGIYVQDADALALYNALMSTRFEFGPEIPDPRQMFSGQSRMAFVAALDGHFAGVVSWERQRNLHPALAATARSFSILQPLPELVAQLNDWRPAFVASYPTMLTLLAREQAEGRLRISPRALWCGGEGLTSADRQLIGESFGCPIAEDYGASECMNMAFGCSHGRLHINDDWVVIEPVDENCRPVPPGEPSVTVLITNLANRVQPLIRYDLSDSVTIDATPCACGSGRPSLRVEGRRDDVLTLRGEAGGFVRILPLAVETVLEEQAGIYRFQLIQTGIGTIRLRLDSRAARQRNSDFRKAEKALRSFLKRHGCHAVSIALDPELPEKHPVSRKLRQVMVLSEVRAAL